MSLCDYLFVCLCAFTWQKIGQAGRPEPFFELCLAYWEIFEAQNFQGWVPFANKLLRMAIQLPLTKMEQSIFHVIKTLRLQANLRK